MRRTKEEEEEQLAAAVTAVPVEETVPPAPDNLIRNRVSTTMLIKDVNGRLAVSRASKSGRLICVGKKTRE